MSSQGVCESSNEWGSAEHCKLLKRRDQLLNLLRSQIGQRQSQIDTIVNCGRTISRDDAESNKKLCACFLLIFRLKKKIDVFAPLYRALELGPDEEALL